MAISSGRAPFLSTLPTKAKSRIYSSCSRTRSNPATIRFYLSAFSLSGSRPTAPPRLQVGHRTSTSNLLSRPTVRCSRMLVNAPWIWADQEQRALALAAATLVPEHFKEVAGRRIAHVDKTLAAVHERLTKEIAFWSDRWLKLKEDQEAGKDVRLNLENARRTVSDLEGRLEGRKKELLSMRHVTSATPVALGGALVIPAGLLRRLRGGTSVEDNSEFSTDPLARARIEKLAMDAVRRIEESRGCRVVDVSAQKCGWDITSYPPAMNGKQPDARHIEVKGRVKGAGTVTITRNEMLYALNQADKFRLAIVLIGEDDAVDGPYYLRNPVRRRTGLGCLVNQL